MRDTRDGDNLVFFCSLFFSLLPGARLSPRGYTKQDPPDEHLAPTVIHVSRAMCTVSGRQVTGKGEGRGGGPLTRQRRREIGKSNYHLRQSNGFCFELFPGSPRPKIKIKIKNKTRKKKFVSLDCRYPTECVRVMMEEQKVQLIQT
ncbi:hypothetical protein LY78DRAFT_448486 [Colletotrichum sublineola]|nr:hypothetical protein LY78DRAFT_448486 [Colletotrichum sublineola]